VAERPRHPDRDLESLLRAVEASGWRVTKGRKYFVIRCPCPELHMSTVHLTPKRHYGKNLRKRLARYTCWKEDGA
jgi:hypothetical protein